jgi:hypothetical protein
MHELDAAVTHTIDGVLVRALYWQGTRTDPLITGIS